MANVSGDHIIRDYFDGALKKSIVGLVNALRVGWRSL
jgi:hypothetical protein